MTTQLSPIHFQTNICVTIDSTPDPALNCVREGLPGMPGNQNNIEAARNLSSCLGQGHGSAIFVGHGNVGYFCTGGGQQPTKVDQIVALNSYQTWLGVFRELLARKASDV